MKRYINDHKKIYGIITALLICTLSFTGWFFTPAITASAAGDESGQPLSEDGGVMIGGGYAVTGQLADVGYTAQIYDATNGLPTSDANYILGATDGYIWIGGYSGIIRYDGNTFERMDASFGMTSGRAIFEDSLGRIWVGTNDNGVVMMNGAETNHFTYKEGLPSSSIRTFAEDERGVVYIGTTSGIAYIDSELRLGQVNDKRLYGKIIIRLVSDSKGRIYGNTKDGDVFVLVDGAVDQYYQSRELGLELITTIYADPDLDSVVYLGTENDLVYCGRFGDHASRMNKISVAPASNVYWITSACDRIWITSENVAGYLDEHNRFRVLENIPMNNSIDMMTADYQGNLWFASSRQGVMKVVSNNFRNITDLAELPPDTVNAVCLRDGMTYIGTDNGLRILDGDYKPVDNELTDYLGDTRIRCIAVDGDDNLWISTFTNNLGLVCQSSQGEIIRYTEHDGMINDQIRCTYMASDGSVLAGTNGGLSVIQDGEVIRSIGSRDGIGNTVFLTVTEGNDGRIYVGTDGDGIYVIDGVSIRRIGRDEGLTSDVILRIKKDDARDILWIITSNSIEYMTPDGSIVNVDTFPYNNNFDIYADDNDNMWILSSYGVFSVKAQAMLDNNITDYRLYTVANGLTCTPTSNAYSAQDDNGNLYISGRTGVCEVNINHYFEEAARIKADIKSVYCDDTQIHPNADGRYVIPAETRRIQITPAIMDYTMTNPLTRIYLEGSGDSGITTEQSRMTALEYTKLKYGNYNLHIQILDQSTGDVIQDEIFDIEKKPKVTELLAVQVFLLVLLAGFAGLIVWRIMTGTIIRRQYEEIRQAKDEAERANSAKSRFLANMSHEIRTPINTIMGMDEMILREDMSGDHKSYCMSVVGYALDIRNASESLLGLVNDLLDMSKIESGKMNLVEQEYDSAELLRSIVTMIRVRSQEKDLTFEVDIDKELPVRLYGDAGKIKQIVLNLLTNAVKYTPQGGFKLQVSVTGRTDDRCSLRISVKDTGIGVKPEDMDKLFTAYERLDEEKNSGIQGTGLGLDISRRFAELMNGHLWCESVYGEGSEFILTVDQGIADPEAIGEFSERDESHMKGPYVPQFVAPEAKILVVDDNPMNLTVIRGLLKATRVDVTTADSGEECLEKIEAGDYHVILLDHMMPGMDGIETLQHIRETHPDQPVYALTANAAAGGEEFYKSKGFDGYLAKPIDSTVLEKALMKHIPEELRLSVTEADTPDEPEDLPDDKKWLYDTEGINVEDGIRYSGGVSSFLFALGMFADTIDTNTEVIRDAYDDGDIKMYTVKVHALKSSARIIGAGELSALAQSLEDAGNAEDLEFIEANNDRFLNDYQAYKDILAPLSDGTPGEGDDEDKPPIPEDELKEAYEALNEAISMMEYDTIEMILEQFDSYRLEAEDLNRVTEIRKKLKAFDWDGMAGVLG